MDTTQPSKVRLSAKSIEQRVVDHATRHGSVSVGGSEQRKVGQIDVEIGVQRTEPGGDVMAVGAVEAALQMPGVRAAVCPAVVGVLEDLMVPEQPDGRRCNVGSEQRGWDVAVRDLQAGIQTRPLKVQ